MKHKVNLRKLLLSVIALCLASNMLLQSAFQLDSDSDRPSSSQKGQDLVQASV